MYEKLFVIHRVMSKSGFKKVGWKGVPQAILEAESMSVRTGTKMVSLLVSVVYIPTKNELPVNKVLSTDFLSVFRDFQPSSALCFV